MKKKAVSMMLVAAMAVSLAVGCGSNGGGASGSGEGKKYDGVTLNYWSMWNSNEPQGQVIQEAADAFSEETGATINIEWKGRTIPSISSRTVMRGSLPSTKTTYMT